MSFLEKFVPQLVDNDLVALLEVDNWGFGFLRARRHLELDSIFLHLDVI